jgi:hypothetical protein
MQMSLKQRTEHLELGENWTFFVGSASQEWIAEAVRGMTLLFPDGELQDK